MCASLLCVPSSPSLMRDSLPSAIFSSLCGALTCHLLACFSVSLSSTICTPCHTLSHSSCTRIRPSLLHVSFSLMHDCQSCHVPFSLSFSVFLACVILALPLACDGSLVRGRVFKVYRNSLACVCASLFCVILTRRQTLPCVILVHASLSLVHPSLSCLILSSCLISVFRSDSFSGILSGASQFKFLLFASLSQATMSFLSELLSDMPFFQIHRMTFFPMCHIQ